MTSIGNWLRDYFRGSKIGYKLSWMVLAFLAPIAVLGYIIIRTTNAEIDFAQSELKGVDYFQSARKVAEVAIENRRVSDEFANAGLNASRDAVRKSQAKLDDAIRGLTEAEKKLGENPHTRGEFEKILLASAVSKNLVNGSTLDAELGRLPQGDAAARKDFEDKAQEWKKLGHADQILEVNNYLVSAVTAIMTEAADASKLTLDPTYEGYSMQAWCLQVIETADNIGLAQVLAIRNLDKKDELNKERFLVLMGKLQRDGDNLASSWEDIEKERKSVAEALKKRYADQLAAREDFVACVDTKMFRAKQATLEKREVIEEGDRAIASLLALYDDSEPQLKLVLNERISKYHSDVYISAAAMVGGLLLVLFVAFMIARLITRQARELTATFSDIGIGDFARRAKVYSEDEIGMASTALNAMLDNTLALIQSREERDAIQTSIMKLLDEVSGVADGDLTKEAEVTADVMGAVADSFNHMISQLRQIIGNVQKATRQVTASATGIYQSAQDLAKGSDEQSTQIVSTSAAVEEMAVSIQQVSENAGVSAAVARQALQNAKEGNNAVRNTISGMDRIRDQVQETAKRIKRLGESTQEIGQIIQLIDDIADRTSILALNASIQAAMAGEAGRGFAVVAEEVERLADRSTDATKKIATLVKTIQSETNEAVGAMEKGIQEVVEGSRVASQAGQALNEIEHVSNQLADLIQSISAASKQQAKASEGVARSMSEISSIAQVTASGTKVTANEVNGLARLAQELRASVAQFKVPGSDSNDYSASLAEIAMPSASTNGRHLVSKGSRF